MSDVPESTVPDSIIRQQVMPKVPAVDSPVRLALIMATLYLAP